MEIRRTVEAEHDLADIYLYTFYQYGINQADKYLEELEAAMQVFAESPKLYRERPEFSPPVRICVQGQHIILYTIQSDFVLIVRVLHSRMDIEDHSADNIAPR